MSYIKEHSQLTIQTVESLYPQLPEVVLKGATSRQLVNKGIVATEGKTNQLVYCAITNTPKIST
ncbi:MAG: hypothetical protein AAFN12_01340 [Cyanobacteria bacterium J06560_2]